MGRNRFSIRKRWMENIWEKQSKIILMFCGIKKKIDPTYVSKHHSNHEKQVVLLMIPNWEGYHYLVVEELSVLLREITSKHHCDFCCLNCLHFLRQKIKFESYKKSMWK